MTDKAPGQALKKAMAEQAKRRKNLSPFGTDAHPRSLWARARMDPEIRKQITERSSKLIADARAMESQLRRQSV